VTTDEMLRRALLLLAECQQVLADHQEPDVLDTEGAIRFLQEVLKSPEAVALTKGVTGPFPVRVTGLGRPVHDMDDLKKVLGQMFGKKSGGE
jgi:hypothetical protein